LSFSATLGEAQKLKVEKDGVISKERMRYAKKAKLFGILKVFDFYDIKNKNRGDNLF
jgi:hypothetical protein